MVDGLSHREAAAAIWGSSQYEFPRMLQYSRRRDIAGAEAAAVARS